MPDWWRNEFYSQFGEDAVVYGYFRKKEFAASRRLDHIQTGFYVDIGAHHPYMISNTWFFYQRGWSGINVEPTPGAKAEFETIRPRDLTLEAAISDVDGEAILFAVGRGVTNSLDPSQISSDGPAPERITVPTMRLETLLDRHLPPGQAIDLLSVDVEGLDLTVLRSNNWSKYRPEIVISELRVTSHQNIVASEMSAEMGRWGYAVYAWVPPSVIFIRH